MAIDDFSSEMSMFKEFLNSSYIKRTFGISSIEFSRITESSAKMQEFDLSLWWFVRWATSVVMKGLGPCLFSRQMRGSVAMLKRIGDIGSPWAIDKSAVRLHIVL